MIFKFVGSLPCYIWIDILQVAWRQSFLDWTKKRGMDWPVLNKVCKRFLCPLIYLSTCIYICICEYVWHIPQHRKCLTGLFKGHYKVIRHRRSPVIAILIIITIIIATTIGPWTSKATWFSLLFLFPECRTRITDLLCSIQSRNKFTLSLKPKKLVIRNEIRNNKMGSQLVKKERLLKSRKRHCY